MYFKALKNTLSTEYLSNDLDLDKYGNLYHGSNLDSVIMWSHRGQTMSQVQNVLQCPSAVAMVK